MLYCSVTCIGGRIDRLEQNVRVNVDGDESVWSGPLILIGFYDHIYRNIMPSGAVIAVPQIGTRLTNVRAKHKKCDITHRNELAISPTAPQQIALEPVEADVRIVWRVEARAFPLKARPSIPRGYNGQAHRHLTVAVPRKKATLA